VSEPKKWNHRFVQFARVHGRTPEEQIEHDRLDNEVVSMWPFICWNGRMLAEWKVLTNFGWPSLCAPEHHAAYDAWLAKLPVLEAVR
jgi:hypothetical protein